MIFLFVNFNNKYKNLLLLFLQNGPPNSQNVTYFHKKNPTIKAVL